MLISEAISAAAALTGQVVSNATLVRWLSELDGRLAFEFYRADAWTPYDPTDDLSCELLVPFPWDGMYVHHLAAQTYFTNGEYDRYENERVMSEKTLADFRSFMQRTQSRQCGCGFPTEKTGGTYVTVIPEQTESVWFWISAYSLAVKHGFSGTEDEWLDSLNGIDGAAAGFGAVSASVDANVGTPSVTVTASGPDTAKVFSFDFHNLKGADGAPAISTTTETSIDGVLVGNGENVSAATAGDGIVIQNGVISLLQTYCDYLDEVTYARPTVATLTPNWPSGNVEIGNSVSVTSFTHKETNSDNVDGTLSLYYNGSRVVVLIYASDTNATVQASITVTRDTAGTATLTLSGTDTHGNTFSKNASKSFYAPKFSGYNAAASVSAADILAMTRSENYVTTLTLASDGYVYWTTTGTITKVTSGGFDVPMEAPVTVSLTINGLTVSYKCYRTSGKLLAGTHSFVIS